MTLLQMSLRALALCAALVPAGAAPALAQDRIEAEVGAGEAPAEPAPGGLEQGTPRPLTPEDVELFVPYEDQVIGRISIPDPKLATLVQPEGREWRAFRIQGLYWTATVVLLATLAALAVFYLWRGPIRIESGRSGRWIPRFGGVERFTHWMTAVSFIVLGLTGLIVLFGRYLIIPLIGHAAYAPLANGAKHIHNWSGAPFLVGVLLMLVLWIRDNLPTREDLVWFREAGGMLRKPGSPHPETGRFNAGQKLIFWSVVLGGLMLAASGYFLMAPFFFTGVTGMQIAHVVHALLAVLLIAVIFAHVYIGTLGMEGAFDAMGRGEVDENWAKEHHRGWYEKGLGRGRGETPARRGGEGVPAE